jgi:hypothetical protein
MAAPSRLRFPNWRGTIFPGGGLAGLLVKCGKKAMPVFVAVFALCGMLIGLIGPLPVRIETGRSGYIADTPVGSDIQEVVSPSRIQPERNIAPAVLGNEP